MIPHDKFNKLVKINNLIAKFSTLSQSTLHKDVNNRMEDSELFQQIIHHLADDANIYDILSQLIDIVDRNKCSFLLTFRK